ncbi:MAG: chloride channel protein [Clostridia bacterium]|nr:chloride channel protein [Clostridia bacterium]
MQKKNSSIGYLTHVLLPVLIYSGISGAVVGAVISLFSFVSDWLSEHSYEIYFFVKNNLYYLPLFFLGLAVLAVLMFLLLTKIPEVKGSGIPRTEGLLRGVLSFRWYRLVIGTLLGSFLSFFGGLSVGSEGPCVQLGAATSQGVSEIGKNDFAWRRYISTGGASTGIAVAFGAPLTGIIFSLEEVHKKIDPLLLVTVATSVFSGCFTSHAISSLWGGKGLLLPIAGTLQPIPVSQSWILLIIGLVCGVFSVLFNKLLLIADKHSAKTKAKQFVFILAIFVLSGIVGLCFLDSVGSGIRIIHKLLSGEYLLKYALLLLGLKLILVTLSLHSGITGGLFIPMLTIGALLGGVIGDIGIMFGMSESYYQTVILLSMAAFLGASIRTPITAMVLIVEATGAGSGFLSLGLEVFFAYIVAEMCQRIPIYHVFLEKEIERANVGKVLQSFSFELLVDGGSFAEGKVVREILWPVTCRIESISRREEVFVPDGRTKLEAGDILRFKAEGYDKAAIEEELCALVMNN